MENITSPRSPKNSVEKAANLLAEQKSQRMQKILENDEKMRVHLHNKVERSSRAFSNTKVTSCSGVLMSNGMSICIPFKTQATNRVNTRRAEKLISHNQ